LLLEVFANTLPGKIASEDVSYSELFIRSSRRSPGAEKPVRNAHQLGQFSGCEEEKMS